MWYYFCLPFLFVFILFVYFYPEIKEWFEWRDMKFPWWLDYLIEGKKSK